MTDLCILRLIRTSFRSCATFRNVGEEVVALQVRGFQLAVCEAIADVFRDLENYCT
jgi:hypothetical protein